MNIAFLIIGLTIIYVLIQLGHNQKVICKNQVQQGKLLQELIDKISKKQLFFILLVVCFFNCIQRTADMSRLFNYLKDKTMSKALFRLKEQIEIDFLKSKTYTEINEMFNQMKQKVDNAESELNKLLISGVVVPKGMLCECGKEHSDIDIEHAMCHKCWLEIKEQHNALQRFVYDQQRIN